MIQEGYFTLDPGESEKSPSGFSAPLTHRKINRCRGLLGAWSGISQSDPVRIAPVYATGGTDCFVARTALQTPLRGFEAVPGFVTGEQVRFLTMVNLERNAPGRKSCSNKKVPVGTDEYLDHRIPLWESDNGFRAVKTDVIWTSPKHHVRSQSNRQDFYMNLAMLMVQAEITDDAKFATAFCEGLPGRFKNYGLFMIQTV